MASLSSKSAEQICDLLDEYGIKHGPVVDSTRSLYERKINEAMARSKKAKPNPPSPDKTYYREEEEEVTYVYRSPVRTDSAGDRSTYFRGRPEWSERELEPTSYSSSYQPAHSRFKSDHREREMLDVGDMYGTPSSYRGSYSQPPPTRSTQEATMAAKSSGLVPMWLQVVVFLGLAVFLYLVFYNMEENEYLQGIE